PMCFFYQAEDGIRYRNVTGVQTCALPIYAACATSSLILAQAAILVEKMHQQRVLAFTSSHTATAERQYRFPNEYGIQKKATTTRSEERRVGKGGRRRE